MTTFAPLHETVRQLFGRSRGKPPGQSGDLRLFGGYETRRVPADYVWDGLKRGGDAARPCLIFQYTLAGWGAYAQGGTVLPIGPGQAFNAVIPGAHRYFLPGESREWTFFWLAIYHQYVVARIAAGQSRHGAVFSAEPDSRFTQRALTLFKYACDGAGDPFSQEQALFEFLIEYERLGHARLYPRARREKLLAEVRACVLARPQRPPGVEELAATYGMSRSHFSHHFKAATGQAPAEYIAEVRLQEVCRLLRDTPDKLARVAALCGFADSNHLCKVFRRHLHTSPAVFRRQHSI